MLKETCLYKESLGAFIGNLYCHALLPLPPPPFLLLFLPFFKIPLLPVPPPAFLSSYLPPS